ncbi:MAG: hypothetical protein LBR29_00485, partial [Methylobacteriaceae bacterium]|nr:hypothetical protein [Methylobacteriaceae bacterium]
MRRGLRTQLSLAFMVLVLMTVGLIGVLSDVFIGRKFEEYVRERQQSRMANIIDNISRQYDASTGAWDVSYIHGIGMLALADGYIIKVFDTAGAPVWDAENHDMSLCAHVRSDIITLMEARRPDVDGTFTTERFSLTADGRSVGSASIGYYGPYFLNESDF